MHSKRKCTHYDPILMTFSVVCELLPSTKTTRAYIHTIRSNVAYGIGALYPRGMCKVTTARITMVFLPRFNHSLRGLKSVNELFEHGGRRTHRVPHPGRVAAAAGSRSCYPTLTPLFFQNTPRMHAKGGEITADVLQVRCCAHRWQR